jgi:MFS family permease
MKKVTEIIRTRIEVPGIFRSLNSRNYRLFFIGQSISLIGTWMQQVALSWLVYRLTGSALLLGIVAFSTQIPIFLFSALAGVYIDRHNRHRILILTQSLGMLQAFIMAALVLTDTITVWMIIVLSVFLGLINTLDFPARQTFVMEIIEKKEDLSNAIALNSSLFNSARLIGPSIGGILIAVIGEGLCFLINGISFLSVIFCLLAMHVRHVKVAVKESHIIRELREGFIYAFRFIAIRNLLLMLAVVSIVGMPYIVLLPIFSNEILGGGADLLGFLMAASAAGSLLATLYLASRKTVRGLEKVVAIGAGIFGTGLIVFSLSGFLPLSFIMIMIMGFGVILQMAASNTVIQTIVDDNKRGRVMSIMVMSFMGMAPLGSLLAGTVADHIGAPYTLLGGGAICLLAALVFTTKFKVLKAALE